MLRQLWVLVLSFVSVVFGELSNVSAQVAFVQAIGTTSATSAATATSITVPPAGVAVGNRIIVMLALNPASGGVSCSDSGANSYVVDRNVRNGSGTKGVRIVILSAHVTTALTHGQTISCTHPNVAARALSANEFSGLLVVSAVDRKNSAVGNNATPASGATATTRQAAELLIGAVGVEGAESEMFTPGTGYTVISRAGTSSSAVADNITINPVYRIVNAIGAYSVTGTLGASRRWAAAIVTYKAAPTVAARVAITSVNSGANPTAGMGFPVVVQAQDNSGTARNVTANTGITLNLKTGTGSLGGALTGVILAGTNQVTIGGATYTKAESGVVITATRTSGENLAPGDSAAFTVMPGPAAVLVFTTQPGNTTAGSPIPGPPTITVRDNLGNTVTSSSASVTVAVGNNPSGGTLSGTITKSAISGVASFTDLSINPGGSGYTLTASATGLSGATSSGFNIASVAPDLVVTSISNPPASALLGASFNVTETTTNSGSASAEASTTSYRLSSDNLINSSDPLLTGLRSISSLGVGENSTGSISVTIPTSLTPGTYFLGACADHSSAVLESAESNNCLASTNTIVVSEPPNISSLSPISASVGTSVGINGSAFGATQGTSTITFNGVATIPTAWGNTSITAPVPIGATTGPVVVTVNGAASNGLNFTVTSKLAITSVNGGTTPAAGSPFSVAVQSQDASGNSATVGVATGVILALKTGTGQLGGTLTGTINPGTNQVTISGVTYTKSESGVILTAARTSGDNLSAGDSPAFAVNPGTASALAFITQPGNANSGDAIPGPISLAVKDTFGNTATSSTASISIAIGTNPSGGILSGTTTKNAVSGVASFSDLSINQAGIGYTLSASAAGLSGTTSNAFNINSSSGVSLAASPTSLAAGNPFTVTWAQIPNPTRSDWIGLYTPGSSETSYLDYVYVSCTSASNVVAESGSCPFPTSNDLAPGMYEFRLFTNGSYTRIATSNLLTVTPGLILTASPDSVPAGATVTVTWTNNPTPTSTDVIKLYRYNSGYVGAPIYVSCTETPNVPLASGSCPYVMPTSPVPGQYEFRLLTNSTTVIATSNQVTVVPPSKLAVSVIHATAGPPGFSMTVESQTSSGARANVLTDTAVSVALKTGTGVLNGTLNGTIPAGSSQLTIGLATYTKAESGVVVTATRISGDALTAGDSPSFTVHGGAPVRLVFATQPGNTAAGSTIPGPPAVAFRDVLGNVTSSAAPITVAIGTNPSAGALSGNMTVTTSENVTFTNLSIDQPGNGYTLTASATGLESATSNPFNITSPDGAGTVAGVITRVSNGATITGALVEAYRGTVLAGTAVTNSSGSYSISELTPETYTVRASFTGLVPQVLSDVVVTTGNTTIIDLSLNFGIAVQSPVEAATVNDFSVLVNGHFDTSLAPEVGITVNGYVALQDGDEFATFVPIDSQTTTLTATLKDTAGNVIAEDTVPITPQLPASEPVLAFRPSPTIALVSDPIGFTLVSLNEISQVELDGNGDGTTDFTGTTLDGLTVTFAEPGLYYPTVRVTDTNSVLYAATGAVQILDIDQLDLLLQGKWNAMKNALRAGDTVTAASYIVTAKQALYQNVFNNLMISFSAIDQYLPSLTLVEQWHNAVEYEITRTEGTDQVTYTVLFTIDVDGVWRIKFF